MYKDNREYLNLNNIFKKKPNAYSEVRGSDLYSNIKGQVWFYQTSYGVLVVADIMGLPKSNNKCKSPIFAFHIHDGASCTGTESDPFQNSGMHYDPNKCEHPYHAGDLPPLFGANGYSFSAVLTNRFEIEEIIGKSIVIHSSYDDFTSQPAGNSGKKIACGEIIKL